MTEEAAGGDSDSESVNAETLRVLLQQLYPDRPNAASASLTEFAEEIRPLNYASIQDLRATLLSVADTLYEREKELATQVLMFVPYFDQLGLARTALRLADPNYANLKPKHRPSSG